MTTRRKLAVAAALAAAIVLGSVSGALATWTSSGSGTSHARALTLRAPSPGAPVCTGTTGNKRTATIVFSNLSLASGRLEATRTYSGNNGATKTEVVVTAYTGGAATLAESVERDVAYSYTFRLLGADPSPWSGPASAPLAVLCPT